VVPPRLRKPKKFRDIDLTDWYTLHPKNSYRFDRLSKKNQAKRLHIDHLTEYALARLTEDEVKEVLRPERRGRKDDLSKIERYAPLHEKGNGVKYKVSPIDEPSKYTKKWRKQYEEKFNQKAPEVDRKTHFQKRFKAVS